MSSAPPQLSSNRFSILAINDDPHSLPQEKSDEDAQPIPPPNGRKPHRPKWERRLSHKLVIRSLEQGPNCIMLPIHLKTTDTLEEATTEAMVDTGATGDFID